MNDICYVFVRNANSHLKRYDYFKFVYKYVYIVYVGQTVLSILQIIVLFKFGTILFQINFQTWRKQMYT